jgi:hypothetical protein
MAMSEESIKQIVIYNEDSRGSPSSESLLNMKMSEESIKADFHLQ